DEYSARHGLDHAHLWAISELNIRNARRNPRAQTRIRDYAPECFTADDTANPIVEGSLSRIDCGPLTDGAAGLVLVSDRYVARHPGFDSRARSRILGWGHRTVGLG